MTSSQDKSLVDCAGSSAGCEVTEGCRCGETYDSFRTGLTFADVKAMMYTGDEDPTTWRCRSRHAVLGYWRELKLQLWAMHVGLCNPEDTQGGSF